MEVRMAEMNKTPIAMGFAATAFLAYTLLSLNALIFPSVADQLLAAVFQLSDTMTAEHVFEPQFETWMFGSALVTGGTYVFVLMGLSMGQAFANVGKRRALHILPQS